MFAGALGGGTMRVRRKVSENEAVPVPATTLRRLFSAGQDFPRIADIMAEEAAAQRRPAGRAPASFGSIRSGGGAAGVGVEAGGSARPGAGLFEKDALRRATLVHIERKASQAAAMPEPTRLGGLRALTSWRKISNGLRLQALNDAMSVAAILATVLMVVENELYTCRGSSNNALRIVVSVLCALVILLLYKSYELEVHAMKIAGQLPYSDTLWSSGMFRGFLFEAFLCAWHTPPGVHFELWVEDTDGQPYAYTEAMLGLTLYLKLYLVLRSFRDHHAICQGGGRFLCNMNGCEASLFFALKAHLERRPLLVLSCMTVFNLVMSAYALTLCERAANPGYKYSAGLWNLYIALTTVGFGDVIPHTYPGRTVVAISVFFGLCTTALLITVVQENLRLTKPESRVLDTLRLARLQREYRNSAVSCVQRLWRMHRRRLARERARAEAAAKGREGEAGEEARPASPAGGRARGGRRRRGGEGEAGGRRAEIIGARELRAAVQGFKVARRAWHDFVEHASISPGDAMEEVLAVVPRVAAIEAEVREVRAAVLELRDALLGPGPAPPPPARRPRPPRPTTIHPRCDGAPAPSTAAARMPKSAPGPQKSRGGAVLNGGPGPGGPGASARGAAGPRDRSPELRAAAASHSAAAAAAAAMAAALAGPGKRMVVPVELEPAAVAVGRQPHVHPHALAHPVSRRVASLSTLPESASRVGSSSLQGPGADGAAPSPAAVAIDDVADFAYRPAGRVPVSFHPLYGGSPAGSDRSRRAPVASASLRRAFPPGAVGLDPDPEGGAEHEEGPAPSSRARAEEPRAEETSTEGAREENELAVQDASGRWDRADA
eukprot:tig00000042_g15505.t1